VIGETKGHLGQSIYLARDRRPGRRRRPKVDLGIEKKNGDFVRKLIEAGRVDTVHDVSDGGLLVAIAEMAMPRGIGASIGLAGLPDAIAFWFGEDQARYVIRRAVCRSRKDRGRSARRFHPGGGTGQDRRRRLTLG
jgi:phosphoribosylformylglycinamidine synthase